MTRENACPPVPGPPSAVLFDLDGVLVDSGRVVEAVWRRWACETGVPADELLAVLHGRPAVDLVRSFAPALDAAAEAARLERCEIAQAGDLAALPGALACVERARTGRWAVVTSGGRALATQRLAAVGIPVPDVFVTADDVTAGKPDPQPYELAAAALGVSPADCLVVEDAPAGVESGKRAGATVFAVTTTHGADALGAADCVFGTMFDVAARLGAIGI